MFAAVVAAVLLAGVPDRARIVCKPDAIRLCSKIDIALAMAGSYGRVIKCFRRHEAELTPACRQELKELE